MFKLFKDILHILQVSSKILLQQWSNSWNENQYSASYLFNKAERMRKQQSKELFDDVIYELYSTIAESSSKGKYRFETEYADYLIGLLQQYYQRSSAEEWMVFMSKLEKDFINVSIDYHNKYPWFITFDWSKHE